MEGTPDSFTVAEAAKVLSLSPKRIRQLIAQGTLSTIKDSSPLRVVSVEVLAMRDQRRRTEGGPRPGPQGTPQVVSLPDVLTLAQAITQRAITASDDSHAKVLQARDRVEDHLKAELARARQETDKLRSEMEERDRVEVELRNEVTQALLEVERLRTELDLVNARNRPWWRRAVDTSAGNARRVAI